MPKAERRAKKRRRPTRKEREQARALHVSRKELLRRARISRALRARAAAKARAVAFAHVAVTRQAVEVATAKKPVAKPKREDPLVRVFQPIVEKFARTVEEGRPTRVVRAGLNMYREAKAVVRQESRTSAEYLRVLRRIQEALHLSDRLGWNIVY